MNRLILDTETLGRPKEPGSLRVYDFGFCIVDGKFNVTKTYQALVKETWAGQFGSMASAYYGDKVTSYHAMICNDGLVTKPCVEVWQETRAIMSEYEISEVWAYNASFDRDALDSTVLACSNGFRNEFMPDHVEWCCIHHVAAQTILQSVRYFKFATENNFKSSKGNVKSSAECAYAFVTRNGDFVEAHTALQDALIEAAILKACYVYAKGKGSWRKIDKHPSGNAWRIVNDEYAKWLEK